MKDKMTFAMTKTTFLWLCIFAVCGGLIYLLKGILLPFVLGFVLAYMLNPIVLKLQKIHFSRNWGSFVVVFGLIFGLLSVLLILIPLLQAQMMAFVRKVPALTGALWDRLLPIFESIKAQIPDAQLEYVQQTLSSKITAFFVDSSNTLIDLFSSWGAPPYRTIVKLSNSLFDFMI